MTSRFSRNLYDRLISKVGCDVFITGPFRKCVPLSSCIPLAEGCPFSQKWVCLQLSIALLLRIAWILSQYIGLLIHAKSFTFYKPQESKFWSQKRVKSVKNNWTFFRYFPRLACLNRLPLSWSLSCYTALVQRPVSWHVSERDIQLTARLQSSL